MSELCRNCGSVKSAEEATHALFEDACPGHCGENGDERDPRPTQSDCAQCIADALRAAESRGAARGRREGLEEAALFAESCETHGADYIAGELRRLASPETTKESK